MVHRALRHLPPHTLFDALCETAFCLPDAVQLLTPCTTGNGWLRVFPLGRFAVTLFNKQSGSGIRVALCPQRVEAWPAIAGWFFKRTTRKEQNLSALHHSIRKAGSDVLMTSQVRVSRAYLQKRCTGETGICPSCRESYPQRHGALCRACQGGSPYVEQVWVDENNRQS